MDFKIFSLTLFIYLSGVLVDKCFSILNMEKYCDAFEADVKPVICWLNIYTNSTVGKPLWPSNGNSTSTEDDETCWCDVKCEKIKQKEEWPAGDEDCCEPEECSDCDQDHDQDEESEQNDENEESDEDDDDDEERRRRSQESKEEKKKKSKPKKPKEEKEKEKDKNEEKPKGNETHSHSKPDKPSWKFSSYKCTPCGSPCNITANDQTPNHKNKYSTRPRCSCVMVGAGQNPKAKCKCTVTCAEFRFDPSLFELEIAHDSGPYPPNYGGWGPQSHSHQVWEKSCIYNVDGLKDWKKDKEKEDKKYSCECSLSKKAEITRDQDFVCVCQQDEEISKIPQHSPHPPHTNQQPHIYFEKLIAKTE